MRDFSPHVVLFGLFAFAIAGCGGDATVEVGVTAQPLQAPFTPPEGGDVAAGERLAVTITEVSVHTAGTTDRPEVTANRPIERAPAEKGGRRSSAERPRSTS